jgi:hypothetical protein
MDSAPNFFGKPDSEILLQIGTALLQVKCERKLTAEDMRKVFGLKVDDMVARYIAGESEMGIVAWHRAVNAWPELAEKLNAK